MTQIIGPTEDTITGLRVIATRKGVLWPLPADVAVASSDSGIVGAALAGDVVTVSRVGAASGSADVTAIGGGLVSPAVTVVVEAGAPDALTIDESGAAHA